MKDQTVEILSKIQTSDALLVDGEYLTNDSHTVPIANTTSLQIHYVDNSRHSVSLVFTEKALDNAYELPMSGSIVMKDITGEEITVALLTRKPFNL